MIVSFRVGNFLSFAGEQSLSFRASSDRSHRESHCVRTPLPAIPRLTRTALILGANASGKSNLLLALRTMRELVLHSTEFSQAEFAEHFKPFGFASNSPVPTAFHIELLLHNVRYSYGFSYTRECIVRESLRVFRNQKPQRWFQRYRPDRSAPENWQPFSPNLTGRRELWRKATRPRALFLTTAAQLNAEPLLPLMHWFEHQMEVGLSSTATDLSLFATRLKEKQFKSIVLGTLQAADIPALDVRVNDSGCVGKGAAMPHPDGHRSAGPSLELLYPRERSAAVWLDSGTASAGAQRLISVLTPLVDGMERDRFVAFDEFDTHLHPLVARLLISVINNPNATHRKVQVLLISHTTALMDLEILRRDEIWLMKLSADLASELTSFVKQKVRKHQVIATAYLKGQYGAVPHIDLSKVHRAPPASAHPSDLPTPHGGPLNGGDANAK